MEIEERIVVIASPGKELGLRLRMKVLKKGFARELDRKFIWIELYSKNGEVEESFGVKFELLRELIDGLKKFPIRTGKKTIVKAEIVS